MSELWYEMKRRSSLDDEQNSKTVLAENQLLELRSLPNDRGRKPHFATAAGVVVFYRDDS